MLRWLKHITISCALLSFSSAYSNEFVVRNLDVDAGLIHPKVNCMYTDSAGYLWIGTQAGLQRYDGNRFKTYLVENPGDYIRNPNIINCMKAYGKYLYLGTRTGFQCLDMQTGRFIPNNKIKTAILHHIEIDSNGSIYFGSARTLYQFQHNKQNNTFRHKAIPEIKSVIAQKNCWVNSIKIFNQKLLLGTDIGLLVFQKNSIARWKMIKNDFNVIDNEAIQNVSARIKEVYINDSVIVALTPINVHVLNYKVQGNELKITEKLNIRSSQFFSEEFQTRNEGNLNKHFYIDRGNSMWISSFDGLFKLENIFDTNPVGKAYTEDFIKGGITSSNTGFISTDTRGNLLVATQNSGIDIISFNPSHSKKIEYNPYDTKFSLSNKRAIAIDVDKDNNLWIAMENGDINVFNPNHERINNVYEEALVKKTINKRYVNHIKSDGDTVFVCHRKGIDIIDRNSHSIKSVIKDIPDLFMGSVRNIEKDKWNNLWIGTRSGGLYKLLPPYERLNFKYYNDDSTQKMNLSSSSIKCMYYDAVFNELFIGSEIGLNQLILNDKGDVEHINKITPSDFTRKQENFINSMSKCNDTVYYLSSYYGVIYKLNVDRTVNLPLLKRLEPYYMQHCGVSYIETITSDKNENIWISGNQIFKINRDKLHNCQNLEPFKKFMTNSSAVNTHGHVYFAGNNGVMIINPDKLHRDTLKPISKITGVYLITSSNNKTESSAPIIRNVLADIGSQKFNHFQNNLRFEFSAFYFPNPEMCTYTYYLEGYDKSVRTVTGKNAYAEYIDLPPGNYKFSVQSELKPGIVSNSTDSYSFSIRRPWWFNRLAQAIYCFVIIGIAYLVILYSKRWIAMKNKILVREEVHQAKLRFFTNISHELRTPLTLIIDPLDKIIREGYSKTQTTKYLPVVRKNANALLDLVNEIMEFRKVETGNLKIWAEETNLLLFTNEILEPFKQKAETSNVNLQVVIEEDVDSAWIDRSKFKRIFYNLLANAFKFTESRITVYISSKPIEFKEKLKNNYTISEGKRLSDYITISVEDDGIGLNQNVLPSIFDRYYQEDSINKLGTGIGLAYTKQLIQLHKGELIVESERNKGTRFIIRLRKDKLHISADQLNAEKDENADTHVNTDSILTEIDTVDNDKQIADIERSLVLIVEDNEDIQNYLFDSLINNYELKLANNGEEGVNLALKYMPDLIITDVMMPIMDGIELCKIVKTNVQISHIPVIMLTAKTSAQHTIEGLEMGADRYIPKPFNIEVLQAHIKNLINNRKLLRDKFKSGKEYDPSQLNINITDKTFFDKLSHIITENIAESAFNVEMLSNKMGMSRRNLQLKLKSVTGMSPLEFIRSVKLNHAAKMLKETELNITEIAYQAGFSSAEHFRKSFKEKFGVAPSKYV